METNHHLLVRGHHTTEISIAGDVVALVDPNHRDQWWPTTDARLATDRAVDEQTFRQDKLVRMTNEVFLTDGYNTVRIMFFPPVFETPLYP